MSEEDTRKYIGITEVVTVTRTYMVKAHDVHDAMNAVEIAKGRYMRHPTYQKRAREAILSTSKPQITRTWTGAILPGVRPKDVE